MQARINRIALGVITRRRPDGLQRLLQSFAAIRIPKDAACEVIVVENDDETRLADVIAELQKTFPFPIRHRLEPELGIPIARNRVLDIANEDGFDFLTFVDDDEVVHPDWLLMLFASMTLRGLDLVGGPRSFQKAEGATFSWQNEIVFKSFRDSLHRYDAFRSRTAFTDQEKTVHIHTNNWMIRLDRQRELGVRFDERLRHTGGSDQVFYSDFVRAGGVTGWASDARAFEIWSPDRLTLLYLFKRMRYQTSNLLQYSEPPPTWKDAIMPLPRAVLRSLFLLLRAPFTRGESIANATRVLAVASGRIMAVRKGTSRLYGDPEND